MTPEYSDSDGGMDTEERERINAIEKVTKEWLRLDKVRRMSLKYSINPFYFLEKRDSPKCFKVIG